MVNTRSVLVRHAGGTIGRVASKKTGKSFVACDADVEKEKEKKLLAFSVVLFLFSCSFSVVLFLSVGRLLCVGVGAMVRRSL